MRRTRVTSRKFKVSWIFLWCWKPFLNCIFLLLLPHMDNNYLNDIASFSLYKQKVYHITRNDYYSSKYHTPSKEFHTRWICVLLICKRSVCCTEEDVYEEQDERTDEHPASTPVEIHFITKDNFHVFDECASPCKKAESAGSLPATKPPTVFLTWWIEYKVA